MLGTACGRDGVEERLRQLQQMNEEHEGEEVDLVYGREEEQQVEEEGSGGAVQSGGWIAEGQGPDCN
jgi:hypothetical protein